MEDESAILRRRQVLECARDNSENVSQVRGGHLLSAKKRRVVSDNCDIVIVFGAKVNDIISEWLLKKLKDSVGLKVEVRHRDCIQSSVFDVYTPFKKLLEAADEHHLPKRLKPEHGSTLREFRQHDLDQFENSNDQNGFFSSQERQWLTLKIVENIRVDSTDLLLLEGLSLLENELIIPTCQAADIIAQIYPLHEIVALERLQKIWVHDCGKQPLDDINNYFGAKIGLYFAWIGHYTVALTIPAILGLIFWVVFSGRNQYFEDVAYLIFCILNMLWASVYLRYWKRYLIQLAYQWGLLNEQEILRNQPLIVSGESSDLTNRTKSSQPFLKTWLVRWNTTIPLMVFSISLVFIMMTLSFRLQDWWDLKLRSFQFQWICLSYIPKICLAIIISLMDRAYYKIAVWLKEHSFERKFENHLIREVTLFQFINSFLSLFYIAFYVQDQVRLKEQLVILLTVRQAINNLRESTIPYMFEQMHLAKFNCGFWSGLIPQRLPDKDKTESEPSNDATSDINQVDLEHTFYKFKSTFDDHLEIVMQFGYVVLFSTTFPLAGLCALLNNIIQLRCGAFKLVYVYQRPFGQRGSNIGIWQDMMTYMSLIAIIVNCALIGVSGQVQRIFPNMTAAQTILLIVILEHVMFGLRFLITCIYPDVPESLIDKLLKLEGQRCENSKITKISESITSFGQEPNKLPRDLTVKPNLSKSRIVLPEIPPFKPKPIQYRESSEESTDDKPGPRLIGGLTNSFEWDGPLQAVPKKGNNEKMSLEPGYCTLSSQDSIKLADSNQSIFSPDDKANQNEEESAVKKTRLKQKLIKRARSVAIFSLKLKERRARESKSIPSTTEELPPTRSGGELSCIPIEKIIQVEDVRIDKNMQSGTI